MSGRAALRWEREDGAEMHHVYMSTSNNPFTWVLIGATTKSRFNADNLVPGTLYWFAVTALGAAGESSKSDVLLARAA
ncbi:MAG: fibronectin type III domain-containing protein [Flavobacteriales bacterium]|nr:fibronectin type III domain-containing protein [Flavobacteriales bacterium]